VVVVRSWSCSVDNAPSYMRHCVSFHGFAGDTQLSKSMVVSDIQAGKRAMTSCIADIESWCRYRELKLNTDKSEVLWLGTRQLIAKLTEANKELTLQSGTLPASVSARKLGVYMDEHLTFDVDARAYSRTCFYQLRRIRQVRRFVNEPSLRQLVQAFVTSCLDYCNELFANCSVTVRQSDCSASRTVPHVSFIYSQCFHKPHRYFRICTRCQ